MNICEKMLRKNISANKIKKCLSMLQITLPAKKLIGSHYCMAEK